jgi:hypothetical protein
MPERRLKHPIKFQTALSQGNAEGTIWDVTILKAGFAPAQPHIFITKEAVLASKDSFDGARVYANSNSDLFGHVSDSSKKGVRDLVGFLKDPYVQGDELRASFHIKPSAQWLKDDLLYFKNQGELDILQLSVDAGFYSDGTIQYGDENIPRVVAVAKGDVDIVPRGAAGGKFNRLVASQQNNNTGDISMQQLKAKLIAIFSLLYPTVLASIDWLKVNENELYSHLLAADKPQGRLHLPEGWDEKTIGPVLDTKITELKAASKKVDDPPPPEPPKKDDDGKQALALKAALDPINKQLEEMKLQACQATLRATLVESKLPDVVQKEVAKLYEGKIFAAKELNDTIASFRQIAAHFTNPDVNNFGMDIQGGADAVDKLQASMELMMATAGSTMKPLKAGSKEYTELDKYKTGPIRSIKDAYIAVTGDVNVTGLKKNSKRLLASLETTDWANILANTLNRQLVKDYAMMNLETWRPFVDVTSPKDFRPQTRVRYGGYGNLPAVAEGAPYLGLSSPTDETANYTVSKRGGTEDITLEMIKNDDVGAVVKIPTRMARAAAQTLHEFVYNLITPGVNGTIYDNVALYYTLTHVNLGSVALSLAGLQAARLRMLKQTQGDNSKRLGIVPGYLLVPSDLEQTAYELCFLQYGQYTATYPAAGGVPDTFLQSLGIQPIRVDYWTDATDWVLVANRTSGVGLEIGFLDGQETPELLVSDLPNVGSWFTNDKTTYKIRHIYSGGILDYRFFDGSVVAG